jgi:glyoxylase-like metal-dependent hydrolase (beta-lactamase superfamily II)
MSGFSELGSLSRRGFLGAASAALAASQMPELHAAAPGPPLLSSGVTPRKISENLFVLEDTCNVFLIRDGSHGLLIDFGSGAILRHLADLGVFQIDFILHTHYHRDQAQGDKLAVAQHIPIAVPEHERHLFEDVERFWRNRRIFELYQVTNNFFSLTENVPVAVSLRDYDTFRWRDHEFFIQPTPGHTLGSISLVAQVDGRKIVFSGDLLYSPGKVQNLYDLQYFYAEHEGVDFSIYSLAVLMQMQPELLCPSHGPEMVDPGGGMQQLSAKLKEWFRYWHPGGSAPTIEFEPVQVSPHLFAHPLATSTFYAIVSDSGKAMFIDYGSASWTFFQAFRDATDTYDYMRFVEHSIDRLQTKHGVKSIDVAIPTHIHDDHLNGFPHLASRYGTKVWCYENMVEILQNPQGRNLGCLLGRPIHIDRSLRKDETFQWEEFEFTIKHSPGHTNYEMALFTTIDNTRVAFTGDAFFNYDKGRKMTHNLIYRNDIKTGDYLQSWRNLVEMRPSVIAPGHGEPFALTEEMLTSFEASVKLQDGIFKELIADPDTDVGLDPSWVQIYPYQAAASRGQPVKLELRVRNHHAVAINVELAMILPVGWGCSPQRVRLTTPAGEVSVAPVEITIPFRWNGTGRRAIAADVKVDGRYVGQIAEAVVDVVSPQRPEKSN